MFLVSGVKLLLFWWYNWAMTDENSATKLIILHYILICTETGMLLSFMYYSCLLVIFPPFSPAKFVKIFSINLRSIIFFVKLSWPDTRINNPYFGYIFGNQENNLLMKWPYIVVNVLVNYTLMRWVNVKYFH